MTYSREKSIMPTFRRTCRRRLTPSYPMPTQSLWRTRVLRRGLEYVKVFINEREIDKEIAATHRDTETSESTRIRKIVNETLPATGQEGEN